jgi:hypothetical protein
MKRFCLAAAFLLLSSAFCLLPCGADDSLDDLFDGLPPAEKVGAKVEKKADPARVPAAEDLLPGEDIELGGAQDPFARIATKMQRSQQALSAGNSKEPTQDLQEEILIDLDSLLKTMEKKCKGGQCNKPGSGSKSGNSSAGAKPNKKPATDSTARVGEAGKTAGPDEKSSAEEALRAVWGHLPPKLREAMENVKADEFLPKYDRLIEEFYRRLAEQPARSG